MNQQGLELLKLVILILSSVLFIPIWRYYVCDKLNFSEFFDLYLLSVLIFLLIVNSNDLLLVYLLIEIQSLIFYVFANFKRMSAFSTEAGLKYFISGSIFSGVFLLGCSLLYGLFGSLNYFTLELLLSIPLLNYSIHTAALIGVLLITCMFFFKLTVFPFHFWAPDVYEGAPLSSTIILATIPKLVLITVLLRWMSVTYYLFLDLSYLFVFLGLSSIIIGIFFANRQKRLKRFIAYSSISQLGYIIIMLSVITQETFAGVYFFLLIYLIGSVTLWNFISLFNFFKLKTSTLSGKENSSLYISNLSNHVQYNKFWAYILLIVFASMAGIPPFSGFLPKLLVFVTLTEANRWFVNVVLVVLTCMVIWYYVNVLAVIFMEVKTASTKNDLLSTANNHYKIYMDDFDYLIAIIGTFLLLFIFLYPSVLFSMCQYFSFAIL